MVKVQLCLAVLYLSHVSPGQPVEKLSVMIDTAVQYQVIDGFGASDAWRAQFVGKNWPLTKRNKIADLLFSKKMDADGNPVGIGLSIWRFYISAGTAEQGDSSDIGNIWRRGECFQNPDGTYDWAKQQGQQWFLRAAKDRGVDRLLAFPNAPPVHMSANGKGYAPKGVIHLNLKPGYLPKYASFLADVVEHFNGLGIHFDFLSPVNEPQWNWDGTGQEGTPALNEEIYALVKYLSGELHTRNLDTRIVIGEAGTIGHASLSLEKIGRKSDGRDDQARFFFNENSPFYIGDLPNVEKTISAHSYHTVWPIEHQVEYRKMVREHLHNANAELGYWMSEYCILQKNGEIGKGGGRDLGMATAMYVARIMHNDLTICNARSWQWWTAISQVDYKDGLVYLDDGSAENGGKMGPAVTSLQHDGAVRDSKLLWTFGHYSRFVRPGMVRIKCAVSEPQSVQNGLLASAYKNRQTDEIVIVFTNLSEEDMHLDAGTQGSISVYTTDEHNSLRFSRQSFREIVIPKRSMVTVVRH